jgi:hypothetical protein
VPPTDSFGQFNWRRRSPYCHRLIRMVHQNT